MDTVVRGPNQKYCRDCGKLIMERAEICPGCGCRQSGIPPYQQPQPFTVPAISPIMGSMVAMCGLNILWSGIGNIVVKDKRGWWFGIINIFVFLLSIMASRMFEEPGFMLFVVLFYAYCNYLGYLFLRESTRDAQRDGELEKQKAIRRSNEEFANRNEPNLEVPALIEEHSDAEEPCRG